MLLACLLRLMPPIRPFVAEVRKLPSQTFIFRFQINDSRAGMRERDLASGLRSFAAGDSCSLFLGFARLTPAQSRTEAPKRRSPHFAASLIILSTLPTVSTGLGFVFCEYHLNPILREM